MTWFGSQQRRAGASCELGNETSGNFLTS
jgi:hypothetical protein